MMDIEKLIERLNCTHGDWYKMRIVMMEAITALSMFQAETAKLWAENERMRAELENYRKSHCSEGGCAAEKDRDLVIAENEQLLSDLRRLQTERDALLAANQRLLAEREQLTAERDAAVSDVSDFSKN